MWPRYQSTRAGGRRLQAVHVVVPAKDDTSQDDDPGGARVTEGGAIGASPPVLQARALWDKRRLCCGHAIRAPMPSHVRLIRRSSKEDIEWAGLAGSRSGLLQPADSQLRPQVIRGVCFIAGVAAAAYLWAVIFGDAVPGLKLGPAIENA